MATRDLPSDDVAHLVDAIDRLTAEQRTANLIAFIGQARKAPEQVTALAQVRERLGISTDRNPR